MNLKAEFETTFSGFSFKRLISGAFNVGFIGSNRTALLWRPSASA
jgi:hypothetical protein